MKGLFAICTAIAVLVCSYCSAQVRAEQFEVTKVTALDFEGLDALRTLAKKWQDEALYAGFHNGMTDRQLFGLHAEVKTLERCADELLAALDTISKPKAKPEDLFVAQQEQNFSTLPPTEQRAPELPPVQVPYKISPKQVPQAPMYRVQQAPVQACGSQGCQQLVTYSYVTPYGSQGAVAGGGGGWRPFANMRARRAARQAAQQGGRQGAFGGCG